MDFFKDFRSRHLQGLRIHFHGVIAADKPVIPANDGILSRQAVAFRGDVQQGINDNGLSLNLFPDGRRRFNQLLLKNLYREVRVEL